MCKTALTGSHLTPIFRMSTTSRSVFHGPGRKLVLAFDVGTTYSGISYRYATLQTEADARYSLTILDNSVLDPGTIPEIRGVTRWVEMILNLINLFNLDIL